MKLLILGGSGQLGRSLLDGNLEMFDVYSPSSMTIDVTDFSKTKEYIFEIRPNFVINATAWTNVVGAELAVAESFLLNADAVGNLASICKTIGSTLIHISTDYVFDGLATTPYVEDHRTSPINIYGASKLAGEDAIYDSGLENFFIIRTSWLYSQYGKNFVKSILSKALKGDPVSISNDQFGSPTYAGDLAEGIIHLTKSNANSGIYNYSNCGVTTWYDFGKSIYKLAGADSSLVSPRKTDVIEVKRPLYSPLSLQKWANSDLSIIRSWDDALLAGLPGIINEIKRVES